MVVMLPFIFYRQDFATEAMLPNILGRIEAMGIGILVCIVTVHNRKGISVVRFPGDSRNPFPRKIRLAQRKIIAGFMLALIRLPDVPFV